MPKVIKGVGVKGGPTTHVMFFCPACSCGHSYQVDPDKHPCWQWNGSMDRPTFTPSLRVRHGGGPDCKPELRVGQVCHLFLTDGVLRFCADSTHDMAGQNVPLADTDW